ncbi:hypothetical protein P775_07040 [Puniceibacterium antarcticum]|uniref:Uncharacterized protein n=1 Tax=Puniceibacterium antarcticum TaxID=1206336 RepID=A0A2G8RHB7_9RHOB|nr:hypothetical protein [Puniceibacterium antarcticum]PIL20912.1 hypothetical protein P775_07040 [Puniceibacterium antarcticum]
MRKTLTRLVASTALAAGMGLPAWSATDAVGDEGSRLFASVFEMNRDAAPMVLASGDDDHESRGFFRFGDDDDDEEDDDCEEDDGGCNGASNPAPAGTVAPPQNGLFGNGAPPKVQVN